MSLSDYIPNIISAPTGYEGLLGAEPTRKLEKQANLQGLLGVAASLAQGMSSQGPRRSALQNILGSLAGGFGATQQAYQGGLQQYGQQQQIAQANIAAEQAKNLRASIEQVMQMPEVANNPALVAALRADPTNTLKYINENMAVQRAYGQAPAAAPQIAPSPVMAAPSPIKQAEALTGGEGVITVPVTEQAAVQTELPPITVVSGAAKLQAQKDRLLEANNRLTGVPTKIAQDAIESNNKQIIALDKQLTQEATATFDFNAIKRNINPDLIPQVNDLEYLAQSGQMDIKDVQNSLRDIQKADFEQKNKQRDYTNESIRVAKSLFPNKSLNELTGPDLSRVQAKLDELEIKKRKAGATTVNVGDKSFATSFGKGVAESVEGTFAAAQGAQSTLGTIQSIRPIIKAGVYSGPLSTVPRVINQLASSLGVTGKDQDEILKNTAVAMQGLASLEMSAAQAMKGQGAITENERGLIKRASAGDLQTFTQAEVLSLLNALEKTSKFKIKAHERNLQRLKSRPDTAELADFYSLDQSGGVEATPAQLIPNPDEIKAEIARRKAKGGK
jgi:hypothetical protein